MPENGNPGIQDRHCLLLQLVEKDHEGQLHWIPLGQYMVIQGLLAERKNEQRVYVEMVEATPEYVWIHDRWPRLVKLEG